MTEKKKRLGRGLDSLIPDKKSRGFQGGNNSEPSRAEGSVEEKETPSGQMLVRTNEIEPNTDQPRKGFDEKSLLELADSLKQFGVLQPLIVQKKDDYYEIVAGERRWRAAKLAGIKEVPVIVRNFSDGEAVEISLIENIQRENLNPVEEALAYKRLLNEFGLKQEEIAEKVSKSRAAVTNSLRLLKLSKRIQQMMTEEMITTGHARALLSIENEETQYRIANKIFKEHLSVRQTEKLIKRLNNRSEKQKIKRENYVLYEDLEEKMETVMGTKVRVKPGAKGRGKIEIEYYSQEGLEHMFELILSIGKVQEG